MTDSGNDPIAVQPGIARARVLKLPSPPLGSGPKGHLIIDLTQGARSPPTITSALAAAIRNGPEARATASRSSSAILVKLVSHKMGETFRTDSGGEEDPLVLAEVLEDVRHYRAQPAEIWFHDGARMRRAFPDLGLCLLDGSVELWEVKPEGLGEKFRGRLEAIGLSLASVGIRYRVRTPFWSRQEPRLSNAKALHRQGDRLLTPGFIAAMAETLPCLPEKTVGCLRRALGAGLADIYAAAAKGGLSIEITRGRLGDNSEIRLPRPGASSGAFELEDASSAGSGRISGVYRPV